MDFRLRESSNIPPTDSLGHFNQVEQLQKVFKFYKRSTTLQQLASSTVEISGEIGESFSLVPISVLHIEDASLIELLCKLRNLHIEIYPNSTPVTLGSTRSWLKNIVIENDMRILFLVVDSFLNIQGHLGLWQRDEKTIELDNVLKSKDCNVRGLFTLAVKAVESWINEVANVSELSLRVLDSNQHAKDFYEKLGYEGVSRSPIQWVTDPDGNKLLTESTNEMANDAWIRMSKCLESDFVPGITIPTAGPSITAFEIGFVEDAVRTGWNTHHSDYLTMFAKVFGEYVGAKYVIPTDSCTSALHLGLWALGIGPGDEVIVPDLTWVATANAVKYVGAKPVFADIDSQTWCIDPEAVRKLITPKTKAIIPVHLYGYVANISALTQIAVEHNLYLMQDAAPGIGSSFDGEGVARFGDFTAFSFQGAKLLVSGEGGVLTTNNQELYEKAFKIADVGRRPGTFWIEEYGKKMKMSNLTAALALGQMQSVERQIAKKRQIQDWYFDGLKSLSDLKFQKEAPGTRSIAWMTSINMSAYQVDRDNVRQQLLTRGVDTRPVFPAISTYPIWDQIYTGEPISNIIGAHSINLPSGVRLKKSTVDHICTQIVEILRN
jgi:perosamine synthetase